MSFLTDPLLLTTLTVPLIMLAAGGMGRLLTGLVAERREDRLALEQYLDRAAMTAVVSVEQDWSAGEIERGEREVEACRRFCDFAAKRRLRIACDSPFARAYVKAALYHMKANTPQQ